MVSLLLSWAALFVAGAVAGSPELLDLPPRYMWGWGPGTSGYCGSASVQTAGIFYGNWLTSDYVRGTSGGHDAQHQLQLTLSGDTSIVHACKRLKLNCTAWDYDKAASPQYKAFIQWTKASIHAGWPVIIGVFWSGDSDPDYDHIVPMVGYDDTAIYMNDLKQNISLRYGEADFVQLRRGCKGKHSPEWCLPKSVNYGVQVHGNVDMEGVLLPIRMKVSSWKEPDYSKEDGMHEKPTEVSADLTISGLTLGGSYALLRYEDPDLVPDCDFLNSKFTEKIVFTATGQIHTYATSFMSDSTTLFRCVHEHQEPSITQVLVV